MGGGGGVEGGRGGGGVRGAGGAGERVRWAGERAILVVVTQCLLLLTRTHHSHTTHTVSWRGGRLGGRGGGVVGGGGGGGLGGGGCWGKGEAGQGEGVRSEET